MISYGRIFRINRLILGVSLEYIVSKVDKNKYKLATTGVLSRMERNKDGMNEELYIHLLSILGLKYNADQQEEINQMVDIEFEKIIEYRLNGKGAYDECIKNIMDKEDIIRTSFSYPKLLVLKIYNNNLDQKQKEFIFEQIQELIDYLSCHQKQFFYDYLGYYYYLKGDDNQAIKYLNIAEAIKTDSDMVGLIKYHRSMVFGKKGLIKEALKDCLDAKQIFDQRLSYKLSLYCYIEVANQYSALREFKKAERIYEHCLQAADVLSLDFIRPLIYNNMNWVYIRSKQYHKIIENTDNLEQYDKYKPDVRLFSSWAYYHLGDKENAKKEIAKAKIYKDTADIYTQKFIIIFSKFLSDKAKPETIERDALKLLHNMEKNGFEYTARQFVIEFIIDFYHLHHEIEKENEFLKRFYVFSIEKCY